MSCSRGCPTPGAHASFGDCLRAKRPRVGYAAEARGLDLSAEKRWHKELDLYESARRQGVQPAGTKTHQIRTALDVSDKTGVAFDAGV